MSESYNIITRNCNKEDSLFQKIMNDRAKAFESSLRNQTLTSKQFKINRQTTGFLQAQNIDVTQFQQVEGLPIQHQLTQELVNVLDVVADYAEEHHYEIYQVHLTKYCVHLAQVTQQSNIQGALQQAIDGTNCCHGIEHYLKGMVSGVSQAYNQFQTALDYFKTVIDSYGALIVQHAAQGAMFAYGLEEIVTVGMITAPTATVAVVGIMIGATAYVMAPLCAQAIIDTVAFGGACITGDWDRVAKDLNHFTTWVTSKENVARMADFAGGAVVPAPNFNYVVNQILSLRPVITSVQNASGEKVQSLYLMTKNQLQKVYSQGLELLQLPEFINFNMSYKNMSGFNFFNILPKNHPALAGVFSGLESGVMSSVEQAALTNLFSQSEGSQVGNVTKASVFSVGSEISQVVEHEVRSLITGQVCSIVQLDEILQKEIAQALSQPMIKTDLTAKITNAKYFELKELASQIRQLQDLAKYTNNFKNIENLIPEDIYYLNKIYDLQTYRAQIKKFLDTYKPYFMYNSQQYFIEDIASYHIHAGEYIRKEKPKGGHSNYTGNKLDCFKPKLIKNGPLGTKKVTFHNPRLNDVTKDSSIYSEVWREYACDLKAIEVMTSDNAEIEADLIKGIINFEGYTSEGLNIRIGYDIKTKRIKTHYPNFD